MSICVVDGGPCQCQPSEGFPCPGVIRLRSERDAAFAMSRCQCGTDEACGNLAGLRAERDNARADRDALRARVAGLDAAITEALRMMGNWPEGAEAVLRDARKGDA